MECDHLAAKEAKQKNKKKQTGSAARLYRQNFSIENPKTGFFCTFLRASVPTTFE